MWNNISFRSCLDAFFQYKIEDDMFLIKCELYCPSLTGGKVYAHNDDTKCCLGSLKYDKGLLLLDRTYPMSFLISNGIQKDEITHFSIETSGGDVITSYPLNSVGNTLDEAQKLLDKMKDAPSKDKAREISNEIKQKICTLKKDALPFLPEFEWYRVEDRKEGFSSSAIRHIVFSPQFMQCFEFSGCWFIGYSEKNNVFALSIKGNSYLPNPMENALDCCVSFDAEKEKYYVVGIGLYDDGQYFVRL